MKKLITIIIAATALLLGAITIGAQPKYKNVIGEKTAKKNPPVIKTGYHNGYYNYRGVYTYHTTKNVWKNRRLFKNTYRIKVLRNGRKTTKLISSVPLYKYGRTKVFYQTKNVRQGKRFYRVTYRVIHLPNGKVKKQIVKKVPIKHRVNW